MLIPSLRDRAIEWIKQTSSLEYEFDSDDITSLVRFIEDEIEAAIAEERMLQQEFENSKA